MIFYKDKTYYLQLSLIDLNGDFVTSFDSGESVDYVIRKSSDGSIIDSGEMTIDENIWKVEWIPTIVGEYSIEYITPDNYENGTETITVEEYDNFKADVSDLALETTLNTKASQDSVDEVKADTESIITSLSTLVSNIWSYATRTLTDFALVASDVWSYITRTLTAGTKDYEIDAIKAETDKIKYILGLSQENYKLTDIVHNVLNEIISAKIKIYASADDCNNEENEIAIYNVVATYDANGKLLTYKVIKT